MLGKIRDGLTPVERITKVRVPRANKEAVRQELQRENLQYFHKSAGSTLIQGLFHGQTATGGPTRSATQ
jgi:hypothetical protein